MDVDKLKAIIAALEGTDVSRLVWTSGEERLLIQRGHGPQAVHTVVAPASAPAPAPLMSVAVPAAAPVAVVAHGHVVTSPFVGTFYRASSPESPPFADVGQVVKKGQTLCIVEAMKLMNEIESEVSGRVMEVLAENGQAVEFGQPLFRIEPA